MKTTPDERELLEVIKEARKMLDGVRKATKDFPPEGRALGQKMVAAAEKTVVNLELALEALRRDQLEVM